MPLYEYRCKQCGHVFEKIQSFSAPEEKECPKCKGEVERLISAPAIQFKGSGWYVSDYAKKSGPMKASGDGGGKSGDGGTKGESGSGTGSGSGEKSAGSGPAGPSGSSGSSGESGGSSSTATNSGTGKSE